MIRAARGASSDEGHGVVGGVGRSSGRRPASCSGWAATLPLTSRSPRSSTSATTCGCTACGSAPTSTPACTPSAAASTPSAAGAGRGRPGRSARSWPPTAPSRRGSASATGTSPPTSSAPGCCAPATRSPTSPPRCATAGSPGVTLLPATDDRVETHVVVDDPATGPDAQRAIHFQEWWVRHRPSCRRTASSRSVPSRRRVLPAARDAILGADAVLLAPSNPVVSIGAMLDVPGMRDALRDTRRPGRRALADRRRARRCAGWPTRACTRSAWRPPPRRWAGTTAAAPRAGCSTAGWCTPATPPTCPVSRSARCRC